MLFGWQLPQWQQIDNFKLQPVAALLPILTSDPRGIPRVILHAINPLTAKCCSEFNPESKSSKLACLLLFADW